MKTYDYTLSDNNGGYLITLEIKMEIGSKFKHNDSLYLVTDFDNDFGFSCKRI